VFDITLVIGNSLVYIMLVMGNNVVDIMLVIGNNVVDIMLETGNGVVDTMLVIGNSVVDILPVFVNSVVDAMLVIARCVVDTMLVSGNSVVDIVFVFSRIFTCLRALIFGEDFSSDPVSRVFGLIVHKSSGGQVQLDTAILSQVRPLAFLQLVTDMQVAGLLSAMLSCKHPNMSIPCTIDMYSRLQDLVA